MIVRHARIAVRQSGWIESDVALVCANVNRRADFARRARAALVKAQSGVAVAAAVRRQDTVVARVESPENLAETPV